MERADDHDALRPVTANEAFAGLASAGQAHTTVVRPDNNPHVWHSIAYASLCQRTGAATDIGTRGNITLEKSGRIRLNGQGNYGSEPAASVAVSFELPFDGQLTCSIRLNRADPTLLGSCIFRLDATELTRLTVAPQVTDYSFPLNLTIGRHQFSIQEVQQTILFHSFTIFRTQIASPGGGAFA